MNVEILAAAQRLKDLIRITPLENSIALSRASGAQVFLKCEQLQYTGSFKVRGALNKLLLLTPAQRAQGVVTASTGNHGAAVAFGLQKLNIPGKIFVPENASTAKVENIRNYHTQLEFYGNDCMQTELHAREQALAQNQVYISPYNDLDVIAGQGTIGVELIQQADDIDAVFVPIGGGGLIAGIANYLKNISPATKIIGCMPQNSPVMAESLKRGKIIDMPTEDTLSDATAGGIEADSVTFLLCQQFVDDTVLVSEAEIQQAIITLIKTQHYLVEGASGVALAAFLKTAQQYQNKKIIVILSGGNISLDTLKKILA